MCATMFYANQHLVRLSVIESEYGGRLPISGQMYMCVCVQSITADSDRLISMEDESPTCSNTNDNN